MKKSSNKKNNTPRGNKRGGRKSIQRFKNTRKRDYTGEWTERLRELDAQPRKGRKKNKRKYYESTNKRTRSFRKASGNLSKRVFAKKITIREYCRPS